MLTMLMNFRSFV